MSKSAKRPPQYGHHDHGPPDSIKKDPIALKVWHQLDYKTPTPPSPGEVRRKRTGTILLVIFLFLFSIFYWYVASAGTQVYLEDERDLGNGYKLCIYSEGVTITVKSHKLCPISIEVGE